MEYLLLRLQLLKKENIVYPNNRVDIKLNNNIFILYKIPNKIDIPKRNFIRPFS